jgi:hypothetical protein
VGQFRNAAIFIFNNFFFVLEATHFFVALQHGKSGSDFVLPGSIMGNKNVSEIWMKYKTLFLNTCKVAKKFLQMNVQKKTMILIFKPY